MMMSYNIENDCFSSALFRIALKKEDSIRLIVTTEPDLRYHSRKTLNMR